MVKVVGGKCKYSDSCFTCPEKDCICGSNEIVVVNKTNYELSRKKYSEVKKMLLTNDKKCCIIQKR